MTDLVYDFEHGFDDPGNKNAWFGRLIGRSSRVLEIGCATGYVGEYLVHEQGCHVTGVEIVPDAAVKARSRGCYDEVLVGDIEELLAHQRVQGPFDHILFGDVLEHLARPADVLRDVATLLDEGGRVLVCVPNVVHWSIRLRVLLGRFDYERTGILDETHLRFFTVRSAERLAADADMVVRSSGGVVWLPSPLNRLPATLRARAEALAARLSPGFFYGQVLLELSPA